MLLSGRQTCGKIMKARLALRISAICFILLGLLVMTVLWITPGVLPGATFERVITTARAWGDVNATFFISFGIFLIIFSEMDNLAFIQRFLFCKYTAHNTDAGRWYFSPCLSNRPTSASFCSTYTFRSVFTLWLEKRSMKQ